MKRFLRCAILDLAFHILLPITRMAMATTKGLLALTHTIMEARNGY